MSEKDSSCKKFLLPFFGFILSTCSILLNVVSDILIKKSAFFNGFENAFIRFCLQLFTLVSISWYNGLNPLGPVESRKLLVIRGIIGGFGVSSHYTALKLLAPSDMKSFYSCRILFGIILGRFLLGEKIGTIQLLSLVFLLSGILSIAQPTFLTNVLYGGYVRKINHVLKEVMLCGAFFRPFYR